MELHSQRDTSIVTSWLIPNWLHQAIQDAMMSRYDTEHASRVSSTNCLRLFCKQEASAVRIRWKLLTLPVLLGTCASLLAAADKPPAGVADKIVIHKSKHLLELYADGKLMKTYKVALGPAAVGAKSCQGDGKTPEGIYRIVGRNPKSAFHKSLRVSYPNEQDRLRAAKIGCSPGGDIMIHGLPNGYGFIGAGHRAKDWTAGCIAVTDAEIEEIWLAVPNGVIVEIMV
jgi:hypothetical protein